MDILLLILISGNIISKNIDINLLREKKEELVKIYEEKRTELLEMYTSIIILIIVITIRLFYKIKEKNRITVDSFRWLKITFLSQLFVFLVGFYKVFIILCLHYIFVDILLVIGSLNYTLNKYLPNLNDELNIESIKIDQLDKILNLLVYIKYDKYLHYIIKMWKNRVLIIFSLRYFYFVVDILLCLLTILFFDDFTNPFSTHFIVLYVINILIDKLYYLSLSLCINMIKSLFENYCK